MIYASAGRLSLGVLALLVNGIIAAIIGANFPITMHIDLEISTRAISKRGTRNAETAQTSITLISFPVKRIRFHELRAATRRLALANRESLSKSARERERERERERRSAANGRSEPIFKRRQ
jgi:hypothetical protein